MGNGLPLPFPIHAMQHTATHTLTLQDRDNFHLVVKRYKKQGEQIMRASSETSPACSSPPCCAHSLRSWRGADMALSKRQQLGQAASVSESREMDFLNIWYSSAGR